jgi:hypothetical protein
VKTLNTQQVSLVFQALKLSHTLCCDLLQHCWLGTLMCRHCRYIQAIWSGSNAWRESNAPDDR